MMVAMTDIEQLPLFDAPTEPKAAKGSAPTIHINPETSLSDAMGVYLDALRLGGFSDYTIKAFRSDLHLLEGWIKKETTIGSIGTSDLSRFLHWLLHERGVPCSPKSYARRVTALKNFFGYLHEMRFLPRNPSSALIQQSAGSPLHEALTPEEIEKALAITRRMRSDPDKPNTRPHLLVTLLLDAGIKKSETMALRPGDVDRTNPKAPLLWVRYTNPRMRYKERKISLDPEWPGILDEYMQQRQPPREIFDCTARNLEYILRDVAVAAGIPGKKLSFESLRWTSALTDYRNKMDSDKLRQKLGLSRIAWRETSSKLSQLAKGSDSAGNEDDDA